MEETASPTEIIFTEPLTVGRLKEILANLEDHIPVVLATDTWYDHVDGIGIPNEDRDPYSCVTFFHGPSWDARDL
jgi:hypothetical protein